MINKNEIIRLAKELSLGPNTIEKDYVLSWILWGINNDPDLSSSWAFKGGTSLKKCFFETFRFSEDLDFTVTDSKHLSTDFLHDKFNIIAEKIYDEAGIEFSHDAFKFEITPQGNGRLSAQGKIHYRGPLGRKRGSASTIKLDLTTDEIIVLDTQTYEVYHPYTDKPLSGIFSNCYVFEEVIAEKIRALAQRARPRDLYDVVHFFRNKHMIKNPQLISNVLVKKCHYKKIPVPTYESIKYHEKLEELGLQWSNMLKRQLSVLPPLEPFWRELEAFFSWLAGNLREQRLVSPTKMDGEIFQPGRISNAFSVDSVIHKIQFAAASRVCVYMLYHDKKRTVEPLSFRKSEKGNKIFFGYEREESTIKRFSLHEIQDVTITNLSYEERDYPIEININGAITMLPITRRK